MDILIAALVLGGMGILFGLLLTLTSKVFAIPANPTRDAIRDVLPGANCGGCGYPGCDGCADAIAAGKAPINACPVGGAGVADQIAAIMGVEAADASARKVARVRCQGTSDNCKVKYDYTGLKDCVAASLVNDGPKSCKFACLGLGTCVKACAFDAIHIDEQRGIAVVDTEKCVACGKCVASCPKGVLELAPATAPVKLLCHSAEKGIAVSDNCKAGCVGCERCKDACKFDAITMVNNQPQVDVSKCRGCMMCAEACPTGAMWADFDHRQIAEINKNECIGCGMCKRMCPFDAIEGERKMPHEITDVCAGCGLCAEKCPKKCITMKTRVHTRDAYRRIVLPAAEIEKPAPAAKPQRTPEMEAKIQAALAAKAAREAAAAKDGNAMKDNETVVQTAEAKKAD